MGDDGRPEDRDRRRALEASAAELEQRVRDRTTELAQTIAELESFSYSVSHDLRSPLVSLLGFSRLLRDDYGDRLDAKGLHFLDRIEQAGRTMESLIADLLELSRIGRSGQALPTSRVNVTRFAMTPTSDPISPTTNNAWTSIAQSKE